MKKLLLGLMLLIGLVGFSQDNKLIYVHNSGDSNGLEYLYSLDSYGAKEHAFEIGAGLTGGQHLNTGYFIATNQVTKFFSLGVKAGGWNLREDHHNTDMRMYYGAVSYLQFTGDERRGWLCALETDNISHITLGLGYKF